MNTIVLYPYPDFIALRLPDGYTCFGRKLPLILFVCIGL